MTTWGAPVKITNQNITKTNINTEAEVKAIKKQNIGIHNIDIMIDIMIISKIGIQKSQRTEKINMLIGTEREIEREIREETKIEKGKDRGIDGMKEINRNQETGKKRKKDQDKNKRIRTNKIDRTSKNRNKFNRVHNN